MTARIRLSLMLCFVLAAAAAHAAPGDGTERYDANHDGYVSFEEWRSMGGEPSAFRASDVDRDRRLSGEEFDKATKRIKQTGTFEVAGITV